ncbi:hypothetical protein ABZX92_44850 [Lentzea sp. NPDC006480]|uniref:hypothetical protein n=1 Tax=Lentzea sp. NPDC006480 TaxID=3157176 RepID=UPI0033AEF3EB
MIENSAAGLVMVPGEVTVTVTGEQHHQDVLARYAVPEGVTRQVAVHLTWCTIATGKYRGQRAIEVRLDGYRVGELTFLMSQRYAPVLMHVESGGGATGCAALVQRGANGLLQVVLRMPREVPRGAVVPVAGARKSWVAPVAISAASLVAFIFTIGVIGAAIGGSPKDKAAPHTTTASPAATTTTVALPSIASSTTTTTTTTATTTTTTTTPPAAAQPQPQPQPQPKPQPAPVPPPAPQPAPQPKCDPNYSGCVPIASDVDCAGGSGDGPAYVAGPIRVIGTDIYRLDSDKDGIACE